MTSIQRVFLGGTCGANHWREERVIPALLAQGIAPEQIINPVVSHWDQQAQTREDAAKADPSTLLLFVLASPDPATPDVTQVSGYSLAEAIMALYDAPERTAVLFNTKGMAKRTARGMQKTEVDLRQRFSHAPIFHTYEPLVEWVASYLLTVEHTPVRPRVVCLCGSTRFAQAFYEANLRETLAGRIVLSIGCDTKSDTDLLLAGTITPEDKARLDELHLRKIDLADEVLILNVGGYLGESTRRELAYARAQGKPIRWWEE